jgi:hypothetical protein
MSTPTVKTADVEQERQQRVAEFGVELGANWAAQFKPGSFGCHELLDRTNLAGDIVEEHVLAHPACVQNPKWYALAEQAVVALRELYQRIGAEHLDAESGRSQVS